MTSTQREHVHCAHHEHSESTEKMNMTTTTQNACAENLAQDWLDQVRWDEKGLVPVIAQEHGSGDVLMFAWMNKEALALTAQKGQAVYFSRSRNKLWHKGEESGNFQQVHSIRLDCDNDVVLLTITQLGHDPAIACHTGRHSCFFQKLENGQWTTVEPVLKDPTQIYSR